MRRSRLFNKPQDKEPKSYLYSKEDVCTLQTNEALDIEFKLGVLSDLLVCPLCEGFFKDAMTIKECLHTFCKSCIYLHLINENDTCPVRDVTIQNLVDKMFPHFALKENEEKKELMETLHELSLNENEKGEASIEKDSKKEEDSNELKNICLPPFYETDMRTSLGVLKATDEWFAHLLDKDKGLSFFKNHCGFTVSLSSADTTNYLEFKTKYIRTSSQTQIMHLALYIADQLHFQKSELRNIELLLQGQVLAHSHSLEFACRSRKLNTSTCIDLQFRVLQENRTTLT
ncbi:polycomb group RING finger protein 3-like isoform X2 [Hylaeus volcanicus]|uniref:polycomb group RING finger protein 3-like isoform X2 n=1 Tax=Hylaeus volcanicus TaxID=313075 RepID=UPI0023B775FD|nr:polycomb group RING finger protein 3-like isoform X2 [Hylaeus volcanicus]